MNCQYCGKELGFVSVAFDLDFCSARHRTKFHDRLKRGMELIGTEVGRIPRMAKPQPIIRIQETVHRAWSPRPIGVQSRINLPVAVLTADCAMPEIVAREMADRSIETGELQADARADNGHGSVTGALPAVVPMETDPLKGAAGSKLPRRGNKRDELLNRLDSLRSSLKSPAQHRLAAMA
jgi:hypothetical protein